MMVENKQRVSGREWWLRRRDVRVQRKRIRNAGVMRNTSSVKWQRSSQRMRVSIVMVPASLIAENETQRAKLRQAIDTAFEVLREPNRAIKFDFSKVTHIYPGGMLIFLAHLELLQLSYPGRVTARSRPGSITTQLLEHFGLAQKLGLPRATRSPSDESVVHWRYLTGTQADGTKITELLNWYRQTVEAEIPEGLYDVLAEALTNVRHHAFPARMKIFEPLKRWWLFARYVAPTVKSPGGLFIAVYDIGIGIQESLKYKLTSGEMVLDAADEIAQLMGMRNLKLLERSLLKKAIEHPRTSTGLGYRGLGLPEMKDFVLGTKTGRLYILSGGAQYSCVASEGQSNVFSCPNGFAGTLILWGIPLHQKVNL